MRFVLGWLGLFALAQGPAASSAGGKAGDILKHVQEALGWSGKFDSVRTLQIEGTLDDASIRIFAKQPSSFLMQLNVPGGRVTQGYDGSAGWQMMDGDSPSAATELDGARLDRIIDQASNAIGGPLVRADARGTHVVYEGSEHAAGRNCYKLKLTLRTGAVMHILIDAETYLEQHEEIVNGDTVIEESVGDFRRFGGILFPCRFVSGGRGDSKTHELRVEKVTINPTLADSIFRMPAKDGNR